MGLILLLINFHSLVGHGNILRIQSLYQTSKHQDNKKKLCYFSPHSTQYRYSYQRMYIYRHFQYCLLLNVAAKVRTMNLLDVHVQARGWN